MKIQSLDELKRLVGSIQSTVLQDAFLAWIAKYCHPVQMQVELEKPWELMEFREQLALRKRLFQSMAEGMAAEQGFDALIEFNGNTALFKAIVLRLDATFDTKLDYKPKRDDNNDNAASLTYERLLLEQPKETL